MRHGTFRLGLVTAVVLVAVGGPVAISVSSAPAASAATNPSNPPSPDTLFGEGGPLAEPIVNELLIDDTVGLGSMNATYFDTNVDVGRQDFASGNADFAVSEFPLSSTDAATAAANGRSFAYVPFAAQGVAVAGVVICNNNPPATDLSAAFCPNLQLTAQQVEGLFTGHIAYWDDATNLGDIFPTSTGLGPAPVNAEYRNVSAELGVDPSAENQALESYLVNDPTAGALYQAWATAIGTGATGAPSELWATRTGVSNGDMGMANQLMPLDELTNAPGATPADWGTGDVAPLAVDWLGAPRFIPPIAIQNAAGSFVLPTTSAEKAAVGDATMDSSNVATFPANGGSDSSAYPMMVMSYLVVPTTGLSAAKATALSQFIDFVLGSEGQKDISALGAVPVTAAMATAGQAVATEVAAEAGPSTTTTTTTPGHSGTTPTTSAVSGSSSNSSSDAAFSSLDSGTGSDGSSGVSLALTGGDPWPVAGIGLFLGIVGFIVRRRIRRPFQAVQ